MNTSLLLQAAYIDGAWLQAQDTVAVDNPATGDIIGHVPIWALPRPSKP